MVQFAFDASTVAPSQGIQAVPAGMYKVVIDEITKEPVSRSTPDNPLWCFSLKLKILDGQYAGRFLFHRLNIGLTDKPKAMEIAYGELSAIQHAVDCIQMQDTDQLLNRPMEVRVAYRPAREVTDPQTQEKKSYDESNDVKLFRKIENSGPGAAAGFTPPPGFGAPQMPPQGFAPQQQQMPPQQGYAPPQQQQAPFAGSPQFPQTQQPSQFPPQQQAPQNFVPPQQQQGFAPDPTQAFAQQGQAQQQAQPPFLQQGAQQPWEGQQPQQQAQPPQQQGGIPSWAQQG